MEEKHILIVDDHEIVRCGLRSLINKHFKGIVVSEAEAYNDLTAGLNNDTVTHLILDLWLREVSMLEKFPVIRRSYPDLFIMVHTMTDQAGYAAWLFEQGADAFLSKGSGEEEAIAALSVFLSYDCRDPEGAASKTSRPLPSRREAIVNPFVALSPRERELALLLLKGNNLKEAQNALHLKSSTVSTMKNRLFTKLRVTNLIELIRLAESFRFS
jgi:DNA-binding NarL/FixJ family response regulator